MQLARPLRPSADRQASAATPGARLTGNEVERAFLDAAGPSSTASQHVSGAPPRYRNALTVVRGVSARSVNGRGRATHAEPPERRAPLRELHLSRTSPTLSRPRARRIETNGPVAAPAAAKGASLAEEPYAPAAQEKDR